MTRALILSGGGFVGISWQAGIADGLLQRGIDVRQADLILGTSGGAACRMRAQADDGPIRFPCADQCARRRESFHLMGPPPVGLDQGAARSSRSRR